MVVKQITLVNETDDDFEVELTVTDDGEVVLDQSYTVEPRDDPTVTGTFLQIEELPTEAGAYTVKATSGETTKTLEMSDATTDLTCVGVRVTHESDDVTMSRIQTTKCGDA